jgi:hypothetical protein
MRSVVHDGLKTTVIDSMTKKPLDGAFAFDRLEGEGKKPHVLATSNAKGEILVVPKTRIVMNVPLGEALIHMHLWVCKKGYAPQIVGARVGWNADFSPSETYTPDVVELSPSSLKSEESCLALECPP